MDKTFAETQGQPAFDWNKFLDEAIDSDLKTWHTGASGLSNSWVTCACGNQCALIPRYPCDDVIDGYYVAQGQPLDKELSTLGLMFNEYIELGDWKTSKEILSKIEARSATLIKQERSKLQEAAS